MELTSENSINLFSTFINKVPRKLWVCSLSFITIIDMAVLAVLLHMTLAKKIKMAKDFILFMEVTSFFYLFTNNRIKLKLI